MIAPSTTALSPLGLAAAAAKPGWCTDAPPASMPTTGWMPGITCVTLPMSVLPSGTAASISSADRGPAQPNHLGAEDVGQPLVRRQFVIRRLGLLDLVVAARRDRTGQEAVAHPVLEVTQRCRVGGAHRVPQHGARGDHVGGLTAVGDDAVRHLARHELLAQQPDRHLRHGDRVGGVDAQIRRDGGVRLPAEVGDLDLRQRQRARTRDVDRAGMQHHRGGDVVERSGVEQQHFSAAGLLGRCAEQHDRQAELVGDVGQRQRGADRRRGDDVVAAGMSDPRQRVVFGADADHQRAAAELGAERGVQPAGGSGDLEAVLGDQRLRLGAALELGERQLRLGVDGVRQLDQVATAPVDCVFDADGGGGGGHPRSISLTAKLPNCDRSGGGSAAGRSRDPRAHRSRAATTSR